MLEGCSLGRGVLWFGAGEVTMVGDVQRAGEEERGSWALSSSSPPFLTARVGAEGAGLDHGDVNKHGYRHETNGSTDLHSNLISPDFCLPGVRHNARKRFKFEFLKISTLGGQHIRQGFQRYFCSEEITCFAKIGI
jgi:hypothetical protein